MENLKRPSDNKLFCTSDQIELFYRYWPADEEYNHEKRAIVIFHRGHEHSGRVEHIVNELALPNTHFFAWDARGHGQSPGDRGYSPSIGRSAQDIDEFIRMISNNYKIKYKNILVIGQSVGAVLVTTWVHDFAPQIRGIILASPAFKVKLYVPFARTGIKFWQKIKGTFYVNSYVKAKALTHDPERITSYENDPLISRPIASNVLLDLYETSERIIDDAAAITLPTQLLISGSDYVVHHKPQFKFFENLRSPIKEQHFLTGFYHDTLGEKERDIAFNKMRDFIDKLYQEPLSTFNYEHEDRWSPSADAYRLLATEPPKTSWKYYYYGIFRALLKRIGWLSGGLTLGLKTGFDSGSTLDYVYQNEPKGKLGIGKIMDKQYLNSPGWIGIRQRKINLEAMIQETIDQLENKNRAVKILDIAAGHGRYIVDSVGDDPRVESVLLRDYSDLNIEKGRTLIQERHLEDRIQFVKGDAFDGADIAMIEPKPTIGIVSGLYELFVENSLLRASLAGLSEAIEEDGYLIYTNQPWHPQQELIARGLSSHRDGIPWAMRIRTQGEMDSLVRDAGFEKCYQYTDQWGIFTVSVAKRIKSHR